MRRAAAALVALLLAHPAQAQDRTERTDAPEFTGYKIVLVGDSTMAPHSGWGGAFCARHVKSSVACVNLARGGRSTRSYRQEGSWDLALREASVEGYRVRYVLIQFGHNDQSSRPERWTERSREFPDNLRRFVADVRATGAKPVLLTPLTRREFRQGQLANNLEPWSAEVRRVAAELKVPLVDLNAISAAQTQRMGAELATKLAQEPPSEEERLAAVAGTTLKARPAEPASAGAPSGNGPRGRVDRKFDYTHLGDAGATVVARWVTAALAPVAPDLRSQLIP
ncbi:rhamnogalacturonan acetylesterase [Leptolyngbya sp. 15MV]|nr:rhamnogalacturonan acetylesterase [Leptolyngbya sp. 15MV]